MIWALIVLAGAWLLGWSICRVVARADADEARANIARRLRVCGLEEPPESEYDRITRRVARMQAEQADQRERDDDRAIADNLDI